MSASSRFFLFLFLPVLLRAQFFVPREPDPLVLAGLPWYLPRGPISRARAAEVLQHYPVITSNGMQASCPPHPLAKKFLLGISIFWMMVTSVSRALVRCTNSRTLTPHLKIHYSKWSTCPRDFGPGPLVHAGRLCTWGALKIAVPIAFLQLLLTAVITTIAPSTRCYS